MPVERPTFHESWYRVADIHPRLRSTVQVSPAAFPRPVVACHSGPHQQRIFSAGGAGVSVYRAARWQRSVGDAWKIVNEHLGDDAPDPGRSDSTLGAVYTANLLQADVPADTHTLFSRYKNASSARSPAT